MSYMFIIGGGLYYMYMLVDSLTSVGKYLMHIQTREQVQQYLKTKQ